MTDFRNPIFCALDTTDLDHAVTLAHELRDDVGGLKLGMEFFYRHGHEGYGRVAAAGLPIFLDLKLHDIPNTVAGGLRAVLPLEPAIVNIHAAGGRRMMTAAAETVREHATRPVWLIAVTVLTSLDIADLEEVGYGADTALGQVSKMAALVDDCGVDGVVCSPLEIAALRESRGPDFRLVVPGIRPEGSAANDQKRTMTPAEACAAGADVLVIGRPITRADDPAAAARAIADGLSGLVPA